MIVSVEISAETRRRIADDVRAAEAFGNTLADALDAGAVLGAEEVVEHLMLGDLGLTMRNPGQGGLASAVRGWTIDRDEPLAAIGVRSNHPAAAYAAIHEHGGTITPTNARALAVPVSEEAKLLSSPREQPDLVMIKRPGRPPLLARPLGDGEIEVHWVLLQSVTIEATHWLSNGVEMARDTIADAAQGVLNAWADRN